MISNGEQSRKRKVNQYSEEERTGILKAYKKSGLTVTEYCSRNEVHKSTLTSWLRKERRKRSKRASFLEAEVSSFIYSSQVEVLFPGGIRLRFSLSPKEQKELLEGLFRC